MDVKLFFKEFYSKKSQITEGYAYAISSQWFRKFQTILKNPNEVNPLSIGSIVNKDIINDSPQIHPCIIGYNLPKKAHITVLQRIFTLKEQVQYEQDYNIVSADVWKFLKQQYKADYDVVVFVIKFLPEFTNLSTFSKLDQELCICNEVIDLQIIILPDDGSQLLAIQTPTCPYQDLVKFKNFIFSIVDHKFDSIKFIIEDYLYFNGQKVQLNEQITLQHMGIQQDKQIIISQKNFTNSQMEEEIEIIENKQQTEQKSFIIQDFLQRLQQTLNYQCTEQLQLKSIQEIRESLEQTDFFRI